VPASQMPGLRARSFGCANAARPSPARFDEEDSAQVYADTESRLQSTIRRQGREDEQRGPEVLRLYADAAEEADIRGCVDRAIKPPPDEK
jgi:hypothetical protein